MSDRDQQAQVLTELASVIRAARREGSMSTPVLTSLVFIQALEAGASALRGVSGRRREEEQTDQGAGSSVKRYRM